MRPARDKGKKRHGAYWVVGPLLAYMAVFTFLPICGVFLLSFFKATPLNVFGAKFVGLRHYQNLLFHDPVFRQGLRNTLLFVGMRCGIGIPLALLIAIPLSRVRKLRQLYTAAMFIPVMFSTVAVALVFSWLFQPQFGMINPVLRSLGILQEGAPNLPLLSGMDQAMYCLVIVDFWASVGFQTVIFLNGLLAIPTTYYEAARVDGSNELGMFWHITIPLVSRTTLFVMVTGVLGSFKIFELPQLFSYMSLMPGRSGQFLSLSIYGGIADYQLGHACALGVIFLAIVLLVTLVQMRVMKTDWEY